MSDQDFFFDEDEQPKKEAAKPAPAAKASTTPAATQAAAPAPMAAQNVSMTVTSLVGVIALLAGVIVGIVLPVGGTPAPAPSAITVPGAGTTGGSTAPQLSPDQLQGGELPPNHPDISGGASGSTTATKTAK